MGDLVLVAAYLGLEILDGRRLLRIRDRQTYSQYWLFDLHDATRLLPSVPLAFNGI